MLSKLIWIALVDGHFVTLEICEHIKPRAHTWVAIAYCVHDEQLISSLKNSVILLI